MRHVYMLVLLVAVTGCAQSGLRPISSVADLEDKNAALVAFSVDSEEPFALRKLELRALGDSQFTGIVRMASAYPGDGLGQLFLYEVPGSSARLGKIRFKYKSRWWETVDVGPEFVAKAGAITYLGRIRLAAVRFMSDNDPARKRPEGVKLTVTDAQLQDLARIVDKFNVPTQTNINVAIPESWAESEYVQIWLMPKPDYADRPVLPDPNSKIGISGSNSSGSAQ